MPSKARLIAQMMSHQTDKIVDGFIPDLAITEVFTVSDLAARDALTVQTGDIAKVTDLEQIYIFNGSSWVELSSATDVEKLISESQETSFVYTSPSGGESFVNEDDSNTQIKYDVGLVSVYKNGVRLVSGENFTASNGFTVELNTNLVGNDVVEVVSIPDGVFYSTVRSTFVYSASSGEVSVTQDDSANSVEYTVGFVDVYKNGLKLVEGEDFSATTGTSITGLTALTSSDTIEIVALAVPSGSQQARSVFVFTASGGETNITQDDSSNSISYTAGLENVYKNGLRLIEGVDYTASTGSSISFTNALVVDDVIEVVALPSVSIYDVASKNHTHAVSELFDVDLTSLEDGSALVYNAVTKKWEVGIAGGAVEEVFYENSTTLSTNYTITSGYNAMTAGPITIEDGVTVTVPPGSVWTIV